MNVCNNHRPDAIVIYDSHFCPLCDARQEIKKLEADNCDLNERVRELEVANDE